MEFVGWFLLLITVLCRPMEKSSSMEGMAFVVCFVLQIMVLYRAISDWAHHHHLYESLWSLH